MLTLLQANFLNLFDWVLTTSAKASIFILFLLGVKFALRHKMGARFQYSIWLVLIIGLVLPWTPNSSVSVYNYLDSSCIQQMIASTVERITQSSSAIVEKKQSGLDQTAVVDSNSSKTTLGTVAQRSSAEDTNSWTAFSFVYKLMYY